jgi:hypothetical protein
MGAGAIDSPILNGPYDAPERHFDIAQHGVTFVPVSNQMHTDSRPVLGPKNR